MTSQLAHSKLLDRKIRMGSAPALSTPTQELAVSALREGNPELALEYLEYAVVEVGTILDYIAPWLKELLVIGSGEVGDWPDHVARLTEVIGVAPPLVGSAEELGSEAAGRARAALERRDVAEFEAAFSTMLATQREVLDAQTDWTWGLLTVLRDALGEERLGEILTTSESHIVDRYKGFDMPVDELVALTVEGMRAIHTGPNRSGRVDVVEEAERWVLTFDPCGTGGRMRRGDPDLGQIPRTEAPYNFGVTKEAHDWSWGEKGVCLYCTHCSITGEIMPIDRNGFPMRVTEYPRNAGDPCRFLIYKSPALVPKQAYERVGRKPPQRT
jgi:hypothetical protein